MKRWLFAAALAAVPSAAFAGCNAYDYVPQDCYQLNDLRARQDEMERKQIEMQRRQELEDMDRRYRAYNDALWGRERDY